MTLNTLHIGHSSDSHIKKLRKEISAWRTRLYLRMEENLVLKDMLADILKNNFNHSHLDQIEEFQNNFINEEQVTNHLRKAIVELQKQSSKILDNSMLKDGFDEKMKKFNEELKQSDLRFQSMVSSFLSFRNQITG
ncbi:MAG: hypothetical protein ACTHM5_12455 [Ginsengibacter sp.]